MQAVEDMCLHKMADRLYNQLQKVRPIASSICGLSVRMQQWCCSLHGMAQTCIKQMHRMLTP